MRGLGDLDVTDFFCGMGGSSSGLTEAGFAVAFVIMMNGESGV